MPHKPNVYAEPRSLKPGTPYSEFNESASWFAREAVDNGEPPAILSKKQKPKRKAMLNVIGLLSACWRVLRLFLFFSLLIAFGITLGIVIIALSFEIGR
jgi:hypothetical protein